MAWGNSHGSGRALGELWRGALCDQLTSSVLQAAHRGQQANELMRVEVLETTRFPFKVQLRFFHQFHQVHLLWKDQLRAREILTLLNRSFFLNLSNCHRRPFTFVDLINLRSRERLLGRKRRSNGRKSAGKNHRCKREMEEAKSPCRP